MDPPALTSRGACEFPSSPKSRSPSPTPFSCSERASCIAEQPEMRSKVQVLLCDQTMTLRLQPYRLMGLQSQAEACRMYMLSRLSDEIVPHPFNAERVSQSTGGLLTCVS